MLARDIAIWLSSIMFIVSLLFIIIHIVFLINNFRLSLKTSGMQYSTWHLIAPNCCFSLFLCEYAGWAKKNRSYLSVNNLATVSGRKVCDMSKVSKCCIEEAQNLRGGAFKYSLSNLHLFSPPLKLC